MELGASLVLFAFRTRPVSDHLSSIDHLCEAVVDLVVRPAVARSGRAMGSEGRVRETRIALVEGDVRRERRRPERCIPHRRARRICRRDASVVIEAAESDIDHLGRTGTCRGARRDRSGHTGRNRGHDRNGAARDAPGAEAEESTCGLLGSWCLS